MLTPRGAPRTPSEGGGSPQRSHATALTGGRAALAWGATTQLRSGGLADSLRAAVGSSAAGAPPPFRVVDDAPPICAHGSGDPPRRGRKARGWLPYPPP